MANDSFSKGLPSTTGRAGICGCVAAPCAAVSGLSLGGGRDHCVAGAAFDRQSWAGITSARWLEGFVGVLWILPSAGWRC